MDTTSTSTALPIIGKPSLFLKSLIIAGMAIALWLPTNIILSLVKERAARQQEAVTDISSKWAGKQIVSPPVICIPYTEQNNGYTTQRQLFVFPDKNQVTAEVIPEKRYRGIYQVIVYRTKISMKGNFKSVAYEQLNIDKAHISWADAKVLFKIQDPLKGINEDLFIDWEGKKLLFNGQFSDPGTLNNAFEAPLDMTAVDNDTSKSYSMSFTLNGSTQLLFSPLARDNFIEIRSAWADPAFTGIKLPDTRQVSEDGFTAQWKFMNRTSSQATDKSNFDLAAAGIGVDLLIRVDNYDKTERSIKYALLCIILTFAAFFLIETIYKRPLHLVQYGLAGLALVLFYTLLLSISEYLGYDLAYLIAGLATIGLVTWFIGSIMRSSKLAIFISLVLVVVYAYIYTLIQLEDFSLLMGSIGLFFSLAVIMYFSRKLDWSKVEIA